VTPETNSPVKTKRPILVWFISGLLVIFVVSSNAYFVTHLLGYGNDTTYAAGLDKLTAFDVARRIVMGLLSLAAATSLFMLRKVAVSLFIGLLVITALIVAYAVSASITPVGASGVLIIPAVMAWYTLRLKKQGVLS